MNFLIFRAPIVGAPIGDALSPVVAGEIAV